MALIYTLLQWAGERKAAPTPHLTEAYDVNRLRCQNRRCISATEDVDQLFHEIDGEPGSYRCAYCEAKLRASGIGRGRPEEGRSVRWNVDKIVYNFIYYKLRFSVKKELSLCRR